MCSLPIQLVLYFLQICCGLSRLAFEIIASWIQLDPVGSSWLVYLVCSAACCMLRICHLLDICVEDATRPGCAGGMRPLKKGEVRDKIRKIRPRCLD